MTVPSAFTLGRVRTIAATTLWGVTAWDASSGDKRSLKAVLQAPGITDAKTLRQQLMGHVGDVVPLTWAADSGVDGYYHVIDAHVAMRGASLAHGLFDVSLELERVADYATPLFESVLVGAVLTNSLGISQGASFLALPSVATDRWRIGTSSVTRATRTSADGALSMDFYNDDFTLVPRYRLAPASYYIGAATLEVEDASAALQVVTGDQIQNKPEGWRLSNGLVRVTPTTDGKLNVSHFDGTQWETAKVFRIEAASRSTTVNDFTDIVVLQNRPEEVRIRLALTFADGLPAHKSLDLSLRRGDYWVRGFLQGEEAVTWKVRRDTAEASTSYTGGIGASANDASGNRYQLASATMTTKDTSNGGLTSPSSTTAGFGIGSEIGGSAAAFPNDLTGDQGVLEQYFAAQNEHMALVGR